MLRGELKIKQQLLIIEADRPLFEKIVLLVARVSLNIGVEFAYLRRCNNLPYCWSTLVLVPNFHSHSDSLPPFGYLRN